MKVYFVANERRIYSNLQSTLDAVVKSMVHYDTQVSQPVIRKDHSYWGEKQNIYYVQVAVFNDYTKRLTIRKRKVQVVVVEENNIPTTTKYLGCEI